MLNAHLCLTQTGKSSQSLTANQPIVTVSRPSLTQISATGSPAGGSTQWSAAAYANISYAPNNTAQSNPNSALLSNGPNPSKTGAPSPGALATISGSYTVGSAPAVSSTFHAPTFGMSCYYTTSQQQWGTPPNSCATTTIYGTVYSGYIANPVGLPAGNYCTAFLAQVSLQGSGQLLDGTDVKYVSGGYPPSGTYQVVTAITGKDGTPVQAGRTVARDLNIIPAKGVLMDINGIGNGLLANDTGGAIVGYRIDYYNGAGPTVCSGFNNIMAVSGCNPGNTGCPSELPFSKEYI